MRCPRCDGLMTEEMFTDVLDSAGNDCAGWRCVNCGEIVDAVVLQNRAHVPVPAQLTKRRWPKVLAA